MPLLLQAITPRPAEAAASAVRGLRGYRLVHVDADDLTAWATVVPADVGSFSRDDLVDHHRVVTEVFARVDACLPARFPTTLADETALRALIMTKLADVRNGLERVRGCAELALTATWTTAEEPAPVVEARTQGRRYLLERQAALAGSERRLARARALADELEAYAGTDLVGARRRLCPSPDIAVSLALLVRRLAAEYLQARLPRSAEDVRILVNGPWPPYTFADL